MLFEKAQDTMSLQEKLAYYLNGAEKTTEQHAALREKLDEVVKEINVVRDDLYLWNEAVEDVRAAIEKEQHPGADKSEDKDSGDSGAAGDGTPEVKGSGDSGAAGDGTPEVKGSGDSGAAGDGTPEVKGSGDSGAAGDSTPEVKGSGDSGVTGDPEKLETVTDEEIQAYIDEMFSGVNDDVEDQKKKLFQLYKQLLEKCTWEQIKNRKDFTTSGIPSSRSRYRTKIVVNSREKTDRTRGGQTGHVHHPRPEYTPDEVVILSKDAYQDANKYTATGKNVTKDLVKLNFQVFVTRYQAQIYKNNETGKEEHAPFPKGIKDEVNYDSSVGAFALMAHSVCRIPVLGVQRLMSEMSDGKLNLSSGMIWNQGLKFSKLALPELTAIKERIKNSPVVNIDHTTVNFNGARQQVLITVGANGTLLFQPVISKGKKGLVGSVLEGYKGISVSDHDKTLCGVGLQHQECLVHLDRTAKGVIKFDPSRAWPPLLRTWFYDAENYWDNVVHPDIIPAAQREPEVAALEARLRKIVTDAMKEYEEKPPGKYYREGYNLVKRIYEDQTDYTLFLHNPLVPPDNNPAERGARVLKRVLAVMMALRSQDGVTILCDNVSTTESMKAKGLNLLKSIATVLSRSYKNLDQVASLV